MVVVSSGPSVRDVRPQRCRCPPHEAPARCVLLRSSPGGLLGHPLACAWKQPGRSNSKQKQKQKQCTLLQRGSPLYFQPVIILTQAGLKSELRLQEEGGGGESAGGEGGGGGECMPESE